MTVENCLRLGGKADEGELGLHDLVLPAFGEHVVDVLDRYEVSICGFEVQDQRTVSARAK